MLLAKFFKINTVFRYGNMMDRSALDKMLKTK